MNLDEDDNKKRRNLVVFCATALAASFLGIPVVAVLLRLLDLNAQTSLHGLRVWFVTFLVFVYLAHRHYYSEESIKTRGQLWRMHRELLGQDKQRYFLKEGLYGSGRTATPEVSAAIESSVREMREKRGLSNEPYRVESVSRSTARVTKQTVCGNVTVSVLAGNASSGQQDPVSFEATITKGTYWKAWLLAWSKALLGHVLSQDLVPTALAIGMAVDLFRKLYVLLIGYWP